MVAFLSYRWGISGPEKHRDLCKVMHRQLERGRLETTDPASLPHGASLAPFWFPAGKAYLVFPLFVLLPISTNPFTTSVEGLLSAERKGGPKSGVAPRREGALSPQSWELCSSQGPGDIVPHQPRSSKNGPWFYSYEMSCFLYVLHSLISWLDFSISTLSLARSSVPLTVARTFCHSSGHNFTVRKPWGLPLLVT